jgi:hypothetical protein
MNIVPGPSKDHNGVAVHDRTPGIPDTHEKMIRGETPLILFNQDVRVTKWPGTTGTIPFTYVSTDQHEKM